MSGQQPNADTRGGGERSRTDAFRFAPGKGVYAFAAIGALGVAVIALVLFDAGGARQRADAVWVVLAGGFLVLVMLALFWVTRRRPVLLTVGPAGLDLPAALVRPIAWGEIWRMRRTRRRVRLGQDFIMLKVELGVGLQVTYKRRLWTWPAVDAWIARKFGLRVPIHNLDAGEALILASIERFKPVQRVTT